MTAKTIDRKMYDDLVRIHEELSTMTDIDHPLIALAAHAARVARDEERPTVWIGSGVIPKSMYPSCSDDPTCKAKGKWGATGIVPPGHVLVRSGRSAYLAHLRTH